MTPKHGGTFNNIDTRGPIGFASTNQAAFVAWSDARATIGENEAEDAYAARIRFTGVAPLGASTGTSGGSKASWAILGAGIALAVGGLLLIGFARRSGTPVAVGKAGQAEPARR